MDNLLRDLEPGKVFYYFEQISKIPRGSRNTKAISDYCVNFAKEKGFKYYQDESNNVIIIKEATSGRESDKGVIIQGHLDMVTEKKPGAAHDFLKEGIKLYVEGDFLHGTDTTLGGDDGIAVAYAFAILDSDDISHPRLEVILTVDEEIGMLGAAKIDLSMIKGKYLLNIDSDEEGILTCGCAGGMTSTCKDRKSTRLNSSHT
jgi:dipeptidase D